MFWLSWLASKLPPPHRIYLCLLSQYWGYRHHTSALAFMWVPGINSGHDDCTANMFNTLSHVNSSKFSKFLSFHHPSFVFFSHTASNSPGNPLNPCVICFDLEPWSSCFHLLRAGITEIHCYAWKSQDQTYDLTHSRQGILSTELYPQSKSDKFLLAISAPAWCYVKSIQGTCYLAVWSMG